VQDELDKGRIVVVAGFQGMSYRRDITTLGRGGSDTTAVALAAALGAEACEIYSDVDGVWSADPRLVEKAQRIDVIAYPEMQELASSGAKVLNTEAVEFAKRAGIALYARQTGSSSPGTLIRVDPPPPAHGVRGIAHRSNMLVLRAPQTQGRALLDVLTSHHVRSNFVVANGLSPQRETYFEVWCARDNLHHIEQLKADLECGVEGLEWYQESGVISLIGEGIMDDPALLLRSLDELAQVGIEHQGIATSSFRISILVQNPLVIQAVKTLHAAFVEAEPVEVIADF
jgi:aspartate kinase